MLIGQLVRRYRLGFSGAISRPFYAPRLGQDAVRDFLVLLDRAEPEFAMQTPTPAQDGRLVAPSLDHAR